MGNFQEFLDALSLPTEEDARRSLPSGRFLDVCLLAQSKTSIIFRAQDTQRHGDLVAIKVQLKGQAAGHELLERFAREAETFAQLDHPHILKVFEVLTGTLPAYVMEYLASTSLRDILNTGVRLPIDQVLRLAGQLTDALHYAHKAGVIHRDLKPANVMLDENYDAKLIDFGIAFLQERTRLTLAGRTLGTPKYMPPEQILGEAVDARADVYSLGILLYELLTGDVPFHTPRGHLAEKYPGIPVDSEVSKGLRDVLRQALEKVPDRRFDSMLEFGSALGSAV